MIRIESKRTRRPVRCAAFVVLMLVLDAGCKPQVPAPLAPPSSSQRAKSDSAFPSATGKSTLSRPTAVPSIAPRFVDAARELGIAFTLQNDAVPDRFFLPEVMGSGVAWIDIDGDGWLDLFLGNGWSLDPATSTGAEPTCRIWRNYDGVRFEEITIPSQLGVTLYAQGCSVGDFDADGFADLYVGGFGPDRLLHNQGDGTFVDVTGVAQVTSPEWTSSTLWIDVDGDDDLDLYAVHYLNVTFANRKVCDYNGQPGYCGPGHYEGVQDRVYLNGGDGTFVESAGRLGFRSDNGKGLAVAAADFDDDFIPEIYVANDMTANFLFKRRRETSPPAPDALLYREVASESGCAVSGSGLNEASMGISLADFDGDGRCDIYLTHYYHTKNTLYKNLGGLIFDDISNWSKVTAISHESLGFGTAPLDYDRDGAMDLFVANGHVLGPHQQPNAMTPQILHNQGGMFTDVSSSAGPYFQSLLLGRSVAAADYDNDGDIDIGISHLNVPFTLLKNETAVASRPYVGLRFLSRSRCHPAGGRVILKTNRSVRSIPITAGGSYLAAADTRVVVGWPESETLESIEVHWPSGAVNQLQDLAIRRYWDVIEGSTQR